MKSKCPITKLPCPLDMVGSLSGQASLRQLCCDLGTQARKLEQLVEALGDDNRYYASQALGHPASAREAIEHYFNNGGAEHFALAKKVKKAFRRHKLRLAA